MEITFKECLQIIFQQEEIPDGEFSLSWGNGATLKQDISEVGTYSIIRRSVHDGTALFTYDLIFRAMKPLLDLTSYDKKSPPQEGEVPHYTIGKIELYDVQEYDKPQRMTWPTMCEEISIPVSVKWEKKCLQ